MNHMNLLIQAYSVFQDALQERYPWLVVILQGAEISTPVSPSKCFADTLKCFAGTSKHFADTSKCFADTSKCFAVTSDCDADTSKCFADTSKSSKCFTGTSECVADTSKCFAETCSSNPAHSRNVGQAFPDLLYKANGQPCDKTVESIQIGPVYENCKTQESLSTAPSLPPRLGYIFALNCFKKWNHSSTPNFSYSYFFPQVPYIFFLKVQFLSQFPLAFDPFSTFFL